jgi:CheY-like chemotaxis protein/anti-sigma regulatory factor (Ser/Thr protein kinase)
MRACSKGIEIVCVLDTSVPGQVRGDGERLKQVLLNLLSNAVKFTQSGEVEVRAELESETATHHVIRISVRDTGIGIPQEAQSKLFSRFSQMDSSTTRNYGGSGLGLAISKQLVELMSGTMGVSSTPGKGSLFWFQVVLEKAETLPEKIRQLPSEMRPMLVVSSNYSMRNALTRSLEALGADISAAANEKEAHIYLKSFSTVTAIISLCSLPEYNLTALMPILDLISVSITEVRFWIILCPLNFVGKIRELIADMAEGFTAQGETLAARAALAVTILAKPVRQKVLYDCLTQIRTHGVYRKGPEHDAGEATMVKQRPSRRSRCDPAAVAIEERPLQPEVVVNLQNEAPVFTVLLAEDSKANRMALSRMLTKYGAVVTVVADGSEAVDLIVTQGWRYKLAFFDLNMPILGGVETLRRIRQAGIDMPVVAISASIEDEQLQQLTHEGFSTVTTKPMKASTCRNILETYGHVLPVDPMKQELDLTAKPSSSPSSTRTSAWSEGMRAWVTGPSVLSGKGEGMVPLAGGGIISRDQHLILVVEDNGGVGSLWVVIK